MVWKISYSARKQQKKPYQTSLSTSLLWLKYNTIPISCNTMQYLTIPYHTIPYHTILYDTIPYNTLRYHTIPYTFWMMQLPKETNQNIWRTWKPQTKKSKQPLSNNNKYLVSNILMFLSSVSSLMPNHCSKTSQWPIVKVVYNSICEWHTLQ